MSKEFEKLVTEAVGVERQLRAAEQWRLSARAWVASLIETSGATPQGYDDFKARIASRGRDELPHLHAYIDTVVRGIGGGNYHSPPGTKHVAVVRGIAGHDLYEDAKDEAGDHGGSVWLLWGLAAERAGERYPERCSVSTQITMPARVGSWSLS